jgi:hypothetical protein
MQIFFIKTIDPFNNLSWDIVKQNVIKIIEGENLPIPQINSSVHIEGIDKTYKVENVGYSYSQNPFIVVICKDEQS